MLIVVNLKEEMADEDAEQLVGARIDTARKQVCIGCSFLAFIMFMYMSGPVSVIAKITVLSQTGNPQRAGHND